ncbi:hypothetical protein D3C76_236460 [compost metagenome]
MTQDLKGRVGVALAYNRFHLMDAPHLRSWCDFWLGADSDPRSASEFCQLDLGFQMLVNQEFSTPVNVDRASNHGVVGWCDVRLHCVMWKPVTRLAIGEVTLQQSQNDCRQAILYCARGYVVTPVQHDR